MLTTLFLVIVIVMLLAALIVLANHSLLGAKIDKRNGHLAPMTLYRPTPPRSKFQRNEQLALKRKI